MAFASLVATDHRSGQVLKELAKRRPIHLAILPTVEGMSGKKVSDYGADIIQVGR